VVAAAEHGPKAEVKRREAIGEADAEGAPLTREWPPVNPPPPPNTRDDKENQPTSQNATKQARQTRHRTSEARSTAAVGPPNPA
jgi:hypothetical protein